MEVPRLGEAERKLAVAVWSLRIKNAVARAIHRLEPVLVTLCLEGEHVLPELVPVTGGPPEVGVVELRRADLVVAALGVLAPAEILEHVPDHHAARMPEGHPGRELGEVDEGEILGEPPVVAALRLLEPMQILLEILGVVEGGAVHARQLRLGLVAAPVSACEREELHRLDRLRVLKVRSAAEIDEIPLLVEGDVPLGSVDQFDLIRLLLLFEVAPRFVAVYLRALPLAAFFDLPPDLLLEALQILLGDGLGELEVVVEAVLDRRPDRHLRPRIKAARGLGKE